MREVFKTEFEYIEFGKYLRRFRADDMIYLCSNNFFIHAPVYVFLNELRTLLRLEVCFCEHNPYTVYL